MQKTKLLNEFAYDETGMLTTADMADKAKKYTCPVCKGDFILKKSTNIGQHTKRPHFAHYNLTENCTPEGILHYLFKNRLFNIIQTAIINKTSMPIVWDCNHCGEKHSGNLLKRAFSIQQEFYAGCARPDIALFDKNGKIYAVVEIVVTHKPEEAVISYYRENNIIPIIITVTSYDDLKNIDTKINSPDTIDFCFNPKCPKCGYYLRKKKLFVFTEPCYKCGTLMKICCINKERFGIKGPDSFNKEELNFAKSKGVILKTHFSRTLKMEYLANTCGNCNAFIGDHYLIEYIIDCEQQVYDVGFFCPNC